MQELQTLSNSTLVSIWCLHGINPNNVIGIQRFSHVVIPIDGYYNLDTGRVGSLIPLLILIVY